MKLELRNRVSGSGGSALALYAPVLLLCGALAWFLREVWSLQPQLDDAYISYRYAQNLIDGHGLVFNPGEYVEGITNLLWTLLVAAGIGFDLDPRLVAHVLGVASGAAVLLVTFKWTLAVGSRPELAAGVACWLLISFTAVPYWAPSGMETMFFTALVSSALLAQIGGRLGLATVLVFLATATRPDGALVGVAMFGCHLIERWREERWRVLCWPGVYAALVLGLTVFRLVYYGLPVPNTFFAKVGGVPLERGVLYALVFLSNGAWLLCLPAAWAAVCEHRLRPAAVYVALVTAYVVGVGGDAFAFSRFFVPVLPALVVASVRGAGLLLALNPALGALAWSALALAIGVNFLGAHPWLPGPMVLVLAAGGGVIAGGLRSRLRPVAALVFAIAAALWISGAYARQELVAGLGAGVSRAEGFESDLRHRAFVERKAAIVAKVLREEEREDLLVAAAGIGAVGYLSGVRILDIFGLVDPRIARTPSDRSAFPVPGHLRSDAGYVFSLAPDYILVPRKGPGGLRLPAIVDIWEHPEFDSHYEWVPAIRGYRRKQP